MDMDTTIVTRSVYNLFMLLGDVGGIYGILVYIASTILSVITFQKS